MRTMPNCPIIIRWRLMTEAQHIGNVVQTDKVERTDGVCLAPVHTMPMHQYSMPQQTSRLAGLVRTPGHCTAAHGTTHRFGLNARALHRSTRSNSQVWFERQGTAPQHTEQLTGLVSALG